METDGLNGQKPVSDGVSRETRASANDGGTWLFRNSLNRRDIRLNRIDERIIHIKTKRRLCTYFGSLGYETKFYLTDRVLNTLGIFELWCVMNNKIAGSIKNIVHWSGYSSSWVRDYTWGMNKCVELGYLERIKFKRGYVIGLTEKGQRIIEMYDKMWDVVIKEIEGRGNVLIEKRGNKAVSFERKSAA